MTTQDTPTTDINLPPLFMPGPRGYDPDEIRAWGRTCFESGRAAVEAKDAEIAELRRALCKTLNWSSYETEYDGRMYTICQSCGGQDGEHLEGCEIPSLTELSVYFTRKAK